MIPAEFCTCTDHACPCNPVNHNKGCDLCIIKCLHANEIPACFFKKISHDRPLDEDYSFHGFARFVQLHTNEEK